MAKMKRIIEICNDKNKGFDVALAVAKASQMPQHVLDTLNFPSYEEKGDVLLKLDLLLLAEPVATASDGSKIAVLNRNWGTVWNMQGGDLGELPVETFARFLNLPAWVQRKVSEGNWDPSGVKKPVAEKPQGAPKEVQKVLPPLTLVERGEGYSIKKRDRNVYILERDGQEPKEFAFLNGKEGARAATGSVIDHPKSKGHGVKTNVPALSQGMHQKKAS